MVIDYGFTWELGEIGGCLGRGGVLLYFIFIDSTAVRNYVRCEYSI